MGYPAKKGKYHEEVGRRLAWVRKQRGMTQEAIGTCLGIGRIAVANIEAGRQYLHADHIAELVYCLDVDPRWLLALDGSTTTAPPPAE